MNRHFALGLLLLPSLTFAQERYATRTGEVSFFSHTPVEDIDAVNHKATCVADLSGGQIQVSMLIKAFEFEKALMQEHFNENYMESNTFPKALFKGALKGVLGAQLATAGTYPVTVDGLLTIHGVEKPAKAEGTITVDGKGGIRAESKFQVKPADHDIKIPGAVRKNIAESIAVTVRMDYSKMP